MKETGKYLLGIDWGTTVIKASLFDVEGNLICAAGREAENLYPAPGCAEYDPESMKKQTFLVCSDIIDKSGIDSKEILSLALATPSPSLFLLDENMKPLYNGFSWQDARGTAYMETVQGKIDEAAWTDIIGGGISYLSNILKLYWMKEQQPEVFSKIRYVVDSQSFMLHAFGAEELVIDNGSAGRSQIQNIHTLEPATYFYEELGLKADYFPKIVQSGTVVGVVSAEAAKMTGLAAGTPLVVAGHDQACCQVGAGVVQNGECNINCGTFGMCSVVTDNLPEDRTDLALKTNLGTKNWSVEGMSISSAVNYKWFRDVLGASEKTISKSFGKSSYWLLNELAAQSSPGANGITYLPHLNGCMFGTHQNPMAKGAFYGLSLKTSKADMVRAVLEGVCYELNDIMGIQKNIGCDIFKVRLSGGVTYSDDWCQMFADIMGIPVELTACNEAGALGAAMFAGVGAGVFTDIVDAVNHCVKVVKVYVPDESKRGAYETAFQKYIEIGKKLNS